MLFGVIVLVSGFLFEMTVLANCEVRLLAVTGAHDLCGIPFLFDRFSVGTSVDAFMDKGVCTCGPVDSIPQGEMSSLKVVACGDSVVFRHELTCNLLGNPRFDTMRVPFLTLVKNLVGSSF